jgi:hypothetical protein
MDVIFDTWEDIGRPGLKFFKQNMIHDIETSFTYQILAELITRLEKNFEEEILKKKKSRRRE